MKMTTIQQLMENIGPDECLRFFSTELGIRIVRERRTDAGVITSSKIVSRLEIERSKCLDPFVADLLWQTAEQVRSQ